MGLRIKLNKAVSGFTLIELLVVLAVAGLLIASAEPTYHAFVQQTGALDTATVFVQTLRRAEVLAQGGRGDAPWGVTIATTSVTLFKGASYASRDMRYDEVYTVNTPVTISGISEVDFALFTGTPNIVGTTTITSTNARATTITINAKGVVTY